MRNIDIIWRFLSLKDESDHMFLLSTITTDAFVVKLPLINHLQVHSKSIQLNSEMSEESLY